MAELVGAVFVAEYVFELLETLDVLGVTGTLEVLEVLELLEATLTDGLVTTPNSAALVQGPRFPASVYAMILTYLARASGKESVLKFLVSG